MTTNRSTAASTLGSELERDRLERRIRRVGIAIDALRQRLGEQTRAEQTSRHVRRAIADFEAQIETMSARLQDLAPENSSTLVQRWIGADEPRS
jgi:hypothetical protein